MQNNPYPKSDAMTGLLFLEWDKSPIRYATDLPINKMFVATVRECIENRTDFAESRRMLQYILKENMILFRFITGAHPLRVNIYQNFHIITLFYLYPAVSA